jgi:hypothetical protein
VTEGRTYCVDRSHQLTPNRAGCKSTVGARLEPPGHTERLLAHEQRVAAELARLGQRPPGTDPRRRKCSRKGRNNGALGRERRRLLLRLLARAGGRMPCRELRLAAGLDWDAFRRLTVPRWFRRLGWKHGGRAAGLVELTPGGWTAVASVDAGDAGGRI